MPIHITDSNGNRLYNRLTDDGSLILAFASGWGFIDRLDIARYGWKVCPGW